MSDSYTFDELRAMGCPDGLLMQYLDWTKEEIDRLVEETKQEVRENE